jgi:hypothetical protein
LYKCPPGAVRVGSVSEPAEAPAEDGAGVGECAAEADGRGVFAIGQGRALEFGEERKVGGGGGVHIELREESWSAERERVGASEVDGGGAGAGGMAAERPGDSPTAAMLSNASAARSGARVSPAPASGMPSSVNVVYFAGRPPAPMPEISP